MKKSFILLVMLAFTSLSVKVNAQHLDGGTTGNLTWSVDVQDSNTILSINGNDTMPDYYYYTGSEGSPWDAYKSNITTVVIGDSVTNIGRSAFRDCTNLTAVTISNSVTRIGSSAFNSCKGLTSVTIPDGVISIGNNAFHDCVGLISVYIGNNVTTIGMEAFTYCRNLISVTIPNSVTSIGSKSFLWCHSLTSVTLSNNLRSIEDAIFSCCTSLISIIIPNSITIIGGSAFDLCSSLVSVIVGNNVDTIHQWAFADCSGLKSITIYAITPPEILTNIVNEVFRNVPDTIPIYIPCGTYNDYSTAFGWDYFSNFIEMPTKKIDTGFYTASFKQGEMYNDNNFTGLTEEGLYYKRIHCDSVVCLNLTSYTNISEWTVDNGQWTIYPNPTDGQLRIENGEWGIENIEIFDTSGKVQKIERRIQNEIDISSLSAGIYFLRVKTEKGTIIKKIIKE